MPSRFARSSLSRAYSSSALRSFSVKGRGANSPLDPVRNGIGDSIGSSGRLFLDTVEVTVLGPQIAQEWDNFQRLARSGLDRLLGGEEEALQVDLLAQPGEQRS